MTLADPPLHFQISDFGDLRISEIGPPEPQNLALLGDCKGETPQKEFRFGPDLRDPCFGGVFPYTKGETAGGGKFWTLNTDLQWGKPAAGGKFCDFGPLK